MSSAARFETPVIPLVIPAVDPAAEKKPVLLLDRDGVLNEDIGYVVHYRDFRWKPGAIETLAAFSHANWHICVVTNQSGIARGYYGEAEVDALHAAIGEDVAASGARIDAFYYCPYHADARVERYKAADHPDRKPNPGMLFRAIREFDADIPRSIMIGDKPSDLEAGRRAGVQVLSFKSGRLDEAVARHFDAAQRG